METIGLDLHKRETQLLLGTQPDAGRSASFNVR